MKKISMTVLVVILMSMCAFLVTALDDTNEIRCISTHIDSNFPIDFVLRATQNQMVLDVGEVKPDVFELNVKMKDEFSDIYCYVEHFSLKGDKEESLISKKEISDGETVINIQSEKAYSFSFETNDRTSKTRYNGILQIMYDFDGTLCLDVQYSDIIKATVQTYQTRSVTHTYTEVESNNTFALADTIDVNSKTVGYINYAEDIDYFKFNVNSSQQGYVNIDLIVPDAYDEDYLAEVDYDLCIYDASGNVISESNNGGYADEFIRLDLTNLSGTYYVEVKPYYHYSATESYEIVTEYIYGSAWFSQIKGQSSYGYYSWDTTNLNNMFFPQSTWNPSYPFINEDNNNDQMYEGCTIASAAMMMKNMVATMYGKDIRTGYTGYLEADPYSAVLANCGVEPDDIVYENGRWNVYHLNATNPIADPFCIYDDYERICSAFSVAAPGKVTLSGTAEEKVAQIEEALMDCPYGLILRFVDGSNVHSVVVVGVDSAEDDYNSRLIVCDSATSVPSKGNNVKFSSSYTYINMNLTFEDAVFIHKFYF